MKNFSIVLSSVAIVLAAAALVVSVKTPCSKTAPAATASFSKEALVNILTQNPEIINDTMQAYQEKQREIEERAANEALASHADEINDSSYAPFVGPENAKAVVVEFFDFSCHFCQDLAPKLEESIKANPDVKYVFKTLSFLGDASVYKAKAAMAADKQGKFYEFYTALMANPDKRSAEEVDALAKEAGINVDQYKTDMDSAEVQEKLNKVQKLASSIRVNGVPTVILNGKRVQAFDPAALQDAINAAK